MVIKTFVLTSGIFVLTTALSIADVQINNIKFKDDGKIIFADNSEQSTATLQGPQGPAGPQGPPGLQGPAGVAYARIVVVSPSGSELENGTALMNALASINTASATKPYLLRIEPGIYDIADNPLIMKEYVDIEGSGENTTIITGTNSGSGPDFPTNGVINGANNAEIRFITLKNTGLGACTAVLVNAGTSPKISHVTVIASGSSLLSTGVINKSSSAPFLTNITVTASGGASSYGIANLASTPTMSNVQTSATSLTSGIAVALYNNSSSPVMTNIVASATSGPGANAYAIMNYNNSSPVMMNIKASATAGTGSIAYAIKNQFSSFTMTNIIAAASGGTANYGIFNEYSSPIMNNMTITATGGSSSLGIFNQYSAPTMSNVIAKASNGTTNCIGLDNSVANTSTSISIDRSTFEGTISVINSSNYNLNIGASKLIGTINNSGTLKCVSVYSGSYDALSGACQPLTP